jgi:hypothetical protein
MLNVIMLNVIKPSFIMLSVINVILIMLTGIRLLVILQTIFFKSDILQCHYAQMLIW